MNVTELDAVAQTLVTEGMGISPVITRPMTYRELLVRLCECFDGYPTHDHQGRLGLALVRTGGTVVATISDADLVDAPDFEPQGWHDTTSETFVRFTNRVKRFKEDAVAYRDRGNFQVTQSVRSQTLARPWVTRQAVATRIAWAAGRADALPTVSGISVNWDRSDPRRNAEGPTETLTPAISRTVVELLTVGGVIKQTFTFAPTGPQTITNAQIVAALGAETSFMLRAWFESAGRRSIESDQITVRKV